MKMELEAEAYKLKKWRESARKDTIVGERE
jgi:hypothetical protein